MWLVNMAGSCFAEYLRDRDAALEAKTRGSKHNLTIDKCFGGECE